PHRQLDLRAVVPVAADLGGAAVPLHAPDYRLAHAAAIGGDLVRIEARAAVVNEDASVAVLDLGVEAHRAALRGELDRVGERLPAGGDERLEAIGQWLVAAPDGP